ncbi:MAG: hypothetical protein A3K22_02210 [Deltaproteobacteria bacterium RBG_16_42_7]|nr:MAG: hypothetical protein A3K22_02210 [Deltaproteobacteria bacterium RBG_16_42_7]
MSDKYMKPERQGLCCCNCQNQRIIFKHPLNKGGGKGRISELMGFGCAVPGFKLGEGISSIIFMDLRHGMCELHKPKVDNKETVTGICDIYETA